MPRTSGLATALALSMMCPAHVYAEPVQSPDEVGRESAFVGQPVSPETLADSYGGRLARDGQYRTMADANAVGFLQQVGRTSQVIMDTWWGQTGAALIDANILAGR